ncbi:MAG: DNA translocase FtsK [Campylobacterales bacterium]|nr:DNA translocase FtsK [Campylobacterales bacterium]
MLQEFSFSKSSYIGLIIYQSIVPIGGIAGFVILNILIFILAMHIYFDLSIALFKEITKKVGEKFLSQSYLEKKEKLKEELTPKYKKQPEEIEEPIPSENEEKEEEKLEVEVDHAKEIEEYLAKKKEEILQVDPDVVEESPYRTRTFTPSNSIKKQEVKKIIEEIKEEELEEKKEEEKPEKPDTNTKQEDPLEKFFQEVQTVDKKEEPPFEKPQIEEKPEVVVEEIPTPSTNVQIVKELEENKKLLDEIEKGEVEKPKDFKLPPLDFLGRSTGAKKDVNEAEIDAKIEDLLEKLKVFKIEGDVVRTYAGPVVTTFEFRPAPNVKVSKILNLEDDIAMALKAQTIRIQAPIPGKDVVGIEIPNVEIETIYLRELLENQNFQEASSPLTMALGKDIVGNPFITDLRKLPHLLIAGTTGSGKSVGINGMILSLLYRNSPDRLKFLMIDPKMLEFSIYNDIPHLLTPVITQPKQAIAAMANMVVEMDRRYALMAKTKTKSLESYNEKAKEEGREEMPFIVVVIDELADLMMQGGKDVEISIARLAQKARACGIHLIIATQRPSTDVITGLIKANLPSRLSYRVGSKIDSKVILDQMGADSLLGRGDLLFTPPGTVGLVRLHAPWSTETEIDDIVEFLKSQKEADYDHSFLDEGGDLAGGSEEKTDYNGKLDDLYEEAKEIVINEKKTSISYIQRKLGIGYNRSANIIEQLELKGVLSAPNAKGQREVVGH